MRTRKELLEKIIQYEDPAQLLQLKRELDKNYGWDGDEDLVQLTRDNIVSILQRYLNVELTAVDVENWAEAIEIREDIEFGVDNEEEVLDIVYILANPAMEGVLTPKIARQLIARLTGASQ